MKYETANANRKHIAFFGKRNAGKSTLFNLLLEEELSLVSEHLGTTTDPVYKAMELVGYGPIRLVDTAGLDDVGDLGKLRIQKSEEVLGKINFAFHVLNGSQEPEKREREDAQLRFQRFRIPYLFIWNQLDKISEKKIEDLQKQYPKDLFVVGEPSQKREQLVQAIIEELTLQEEDPPLIGDLLPYGSKVILVVPIDTEAPKGRLILPQVQLIRECLDYGIKTYVVRDTELTSVLEENSDASLVITDSQIFGRVDAMVPKEIPLTSFSILFARQKGEIQEFLDGVEALEALKGKKNPNILIAESCTHTRSHEDIGTVKIPRLLKKKIREDIKIEFQHGSKVEENLEEFDLVIHCGSCMLTRKMMLNRIQMAKEKQVAITNYGVVLAYLNGILKRSVEIFKEAKK